jgi:predicted phage replisome organizer
MMRMRERKFVKFRVDMYDDTKFKIIDMKPERDLIHYVWTRIVTLAGKVNLEGDLYMSKNLPYTIETLAIEFNRSEEQIKLALDIFVELEMVELIEGSIYRVKNFVKHQNIKVKEKIKTQEKEHELKNIEVVMKEVSKNEICENEEKEGDEKTGKNKAEDIRNHNKRDLEIASSGINKVSDSANEINNDSSQDNAAIHFESKEIKKTTRKKKKDEQFDITDEGAVEDNVICWVTDGELPVNERDKVIMSMEF